MKTLRNILSETLIEQGSDYYATGENLDEIMRVFREEQILAIIEHDCQLLDVDRWVILEELLNQELDYESAMRIEKAFYESDIETLDLAY